MLEPQRSEEEGDARADNKDRAAPGPEAEVVEGDAEKNVWVAEGEAEEAVEEEEIGEEEEEEPEEEQREDDHPDSDPESLRRSESLDPVDHFFRGMNELGMLSDPLPMRPTEPLQMPLPRPQITAAVAPVETAQGEAVVAAVDVTQPSITLPIPPSDTVAPLIPRSEGRAEIRQKSPPPIRGGVQFPEPKSTRIARGFGLSGETGSLAALPGSRSRDRTPVASSAAPASTRSASLPPPIRLIPKLHKPVVRKTPVLPAVASRLPPPKPVASSGIRKPAPSTTKTSTARRPTGSSTAKPPVRRPTVERKISNSSNAPSTAPASGSRKGVTTTGSSAVRKPLSGPTGGRAIGGSGAGAGTVGGAAAAASNKANPAKNMYASMSKKKDSVKPVLPGGTSSSPATSTSTATTVSSSSTSISPSVSAPSMSSSTSASATTSAVSGSSSSSSVPSTSAPASTSTSTSTTVASGPASQPLTKQASSTQEINTANSQSGAGSGSGSGSGSVSVSGNGATGPSLSKAMEDARAEVTRLKDLLSKKEGELTALRRSLVDSLPCNTCGLFGLPCDRKEPCFQCHKAHTYCLYRNRCKPVVVRGMAISSPASTSASSTSSSSVAGTTSDSSAQQSRPGDGPSSPSSDQERWRQEVHTSAAHYRSRQQELEDEAQRLREENQRLRLELVCGGRVPSDVTVLLLAGLYRRPRAHVANEKWHQIHNLNVDPLPASLPAIGEVLPRKQPRSVRKNVQFQPNLTSEIEIK